MIPHDKNGRVYLRIADAKAGQTIELDDAFTCCKTGKATLFTNNNGLLGFKCDSGEHLLGGQAEDDYYLGAYPVN